MTSHYLERIEKYDDELNSFISITAERALIQAKDSDERYANNQAFGLDGIPLAHKDIFAQKDVLTTCGSKMLHNRFALLFYSIRKTRCSRNGDARKNKYG